MHSRYIVYLAPPSSLLRATVGYSPASFFALRPLLIDRSRRKTLHTLHVVYFVTQTETVT